MSHAERDSAICILLVRLSASRLYTVLKQ